MKTFTLTLCIVLISFSLTAQKSNDLKGPAYKNYKPWMNNNKPTIVYTKSKKEVLKGPAYKNQKPWDKINEVTYIPIVYNSGRFKLKGPAYKNYKPWRKNTKE